MALWSGDDHGSLPHVFACFRYRLFGERRERLCRNSARLKGKRQGCILHVGQTPVWDLFRAGISICRIRPISHSVGSVLKFCLPCSDSVLVVPPSSTAIEECRFLISDDSVSIFLAAFSGFDGLLLPTVPKCSARAVVQPPRILPLFLCQAASPGKTSPPAVRFCPADPGHAIDTDLCVFCDGAFSLPGSD